MKNKSIVSLIGMIILLSVGVGCNNNSTPVKTQPVKESSQSVRSQPLEYDKEKVENTLMAYFDSLNKDRLDEYRSVVKKSYEMQQKDWDALQQYLVCIKDIEINFNKATYSDGTIKVPVKFTQIMDDNYIPSNINPGENNVTRDFFLEIDSEGNYYIADFSSVY